jgi:transcriptional regulator with XRE-family HTH domain
VVYNEYMSMHMHDPLLPDDPRLQAAALLAYFIGRRRTILHLSIEESARLSGLELSQWYALESGWMPEDRLDIQAIAATLEVPEEDIQSFVAMRRLRQAGYYPPYS